MKILDDLLSVIENHPVQDVLVGLYTTLVQSKRCGLASTLKNNCCQSTPPTEYNDLRQLTSVELANYVYLPDLTLASIGMAALNSALPEMKNDKHIINAKKLLQEKGENKIVGVIGHFPFLDHLKSSSKKLMIFEKNPRPGDLKENDMEKYLPEADVIAITATSLINHSLENILRFRKKNSFVIMLGPSTPLSPVMFDFGIDALSGSLVGNYDEAVTKIKQAFPFRFITGLKYVTVFKDEIS